MIQNKTRKRVRAASSEQLLLLAVLAGSHFRSVIDRELHRRRFDTDDAGARRKRRGRTP
jgi:hypothetical protein